MDIKKEIEFFIEQEESSGALMINGEWGSGKTHLIKQIANEYNYNKKAAVAVISLFGLDSIEAINKRVKEEYAFFNFGQLNFKTGKKIAKVGKDIFSLASTASQGNIPLATAAKGFSTLLSFDFLDFFEVTNIIKSGGHQIPFILIFDDLERCSISIFDLIGVINEYSENKKIKVIVIANEGKINVDESNENRNFDEFKEKLVSRTLRFNSSTNSVIVLIIDSYRTETDSYKQFINDSKDVFINAFNQSKYNNLRSLKACICDFERVFSIMSELEIPDSQKRELLYKFCVITFEAKKGVYTRFGDYQIYSIFNEPDTSSPNIEKEKISIIKRKYSAEAFNQIPASISMWVVDGNFDEKLMFEELKEKYFPELLSQEQKFINYSIWDLEDEDIENGMKYWLDKAYSGEATCDELTSLLSRLFIFSKMDFKFSVDIDYSKILNGFKLRKHKIKNGNIIEPKSHTFCTKDKIDPAAIPILDGIEHIEYFIWSCDNRKKFIKLLSQKPVENCFSVKGCPIDAFDDELLNIFSNAYFSSLNSDRKEYATALIGLIFNNKDYSSADDFAKTKNNFNILIAKLNEDIRSNAGTISKIISQDLINELLKIIDGLNESY